MEYLFYSSLIFIGLSFLFLIVLPISDFICRFFDMHGRSRLSQEKNMIEKTGQWFWIGIIVIWLTWTVVDFLGQLCGTE